MVLEVGMRVRNVGRYHTLNPTGKITDLYVAGGEPMCRVVWDGGGWAQTTQASVEPLVTGPVEVL